MTDRLAEIRARLEAATPGPWEHWERPNCCVVHEEAGIKWEVVGGGRFEDHAFIAHAPEDIAWLLGEVERLEERLDRWDNLAMSAD